MRWRRILPTVARHNPLAVIVRMMFVDAGSAGEVTSRTARAKGLTRGCASLSFMLCGNAGMLPVVTVIGLQVGTRAAGGRDSDRNYLLVARSGALADRCAATPRLSGSAGRRVTGQRR